jgi:thymidine kinase
MAKLFFRYGAMNSGKSTALLQVAHNYEERGMHVLLVKAKIDSKGNDRIVSRLGMDRKVDVLSDETTNLYQVIAQWHKDVEKVSCILVDEAQFLSKKQVDQLFNLTIYDKIPVICYGLRTDFQTNLFPGAERLFALAHSLEELKTICRCGKKAMMNGRKINNRFVFEGSQVAIDGSQDITYESLCGDCYFVELSKLN